MHKRFHVLFAACLLAMSSRALADDKAAPVKVPVADCDCDVTALEKFFVPHDKGDHHIDNPLYFWWLMEAKKDVSREDLARHLSRVYLELKDENGVAYYTGRIKIGLSLKGDGDSPDTWASGAWGDVPFEKGEKVYFKFFLLRRGDLRKAKSAAFKLGKERP